MRAAILALLAEEPMHGYQLMGEIAERTGGAWRPSPGSVYPTLQQLADEGLVHGAESEGGRRLFSLTDAGREAAEAVTAAGAPWESAGAEADRPVEQLRDLVFQVMAAARQVVHAGDAGQIAQASDVLRDTRRRLYGVLAADPSETDEAREPDEPA